MKRIVPRDSFAQIPDNMHCVPLDTFVLKARTPPFHAAMVISVLGAGHMIDSMKLFIIPLCLVGLSQMILVLKGFIALRPLCSCRAIQGNGALPVQLSHLFVLRGTIAVKMAHLAFAQMANTVQKVPSKVELAPLDFLVGGLTTIRLSGVQQVWACIALIFRGKLSLALLDSIANILARNLFAQEDRIVQRAQWPQFRAQNLAHIALPCRLNRCLAKIPLDLGMLSSVIARIQACVACVLRVFIVGST